MTNMTYALSEERELFWGGQADCLEWFEPWNQVLEWNPPYAQWFLNGKLNACYNCLDRHMKTEIKHKSALIGKERTVSNVP